MAIQFQFSVEKLTLFDPGADGAMGSANPVVITPIAEDSVTLSIPERTTTDINAEDWDGVVASLPAEQEAISLNFQTLDFSNEMLVTLFGGSNVGGVYSFPATGVPIIQRSLELITRPYGGVKSKFQFPLVQLTPSGDIQFSKNDVSKISVTAKVLTPMDSTGTPLSQFQKSTIPAAS